MLTFLPLAENPFLVLEALDGEKLSQLHLYNLERLYFEDVPLSLPLANLFTAKTSVGKALTHLTLTVQWNEDGITLPLLQAIVTCCPSLEYLDMTIDKQVNIFLFISLSLQLTSLPFYYPPIIASF